MGSIAVNRTLTALNLSDNKLSAEAGGAIASALQRSDSLQVLVIGSNALGDSGVAAICRGLRTLFDSDRRQCVALCVTVLLPLSWPHCACTL